MAIYGFDLFSHENAMDGFVVVAAAAVWLYFWSGGGGTPVEWELALFNGEPLI